MNRVHVPYGIYEPLSWHPDVDTPEYPVFTCPNRHNSVMRNHRIDPDGTVNGSVLCHIEGCFHEFVILDDYAERMHS